MGFAEPFDWNQNGKVDIEDWIIEEEQRRLSEERWKQRQDKKSYDFPQPPSTDAFSLNVFPGHGLKGGRIKSPKKLFNPAVLLYLPVDGSRCISTILTKNKSRLHCINVTEILWCG